tara:strand:+ start:3675 stop:4400 length:726 start_codon:yes stop_codon:yes gene_type:complete
MYQNHTQVGRTRVNKIREGKKNPPGSKELYKRDGLTHVRPRSSISNDIPQYKVVGQIKKKNVTGMDKLYSLQKDLLMDGLSLEEYKDYVQDKINNGKYYYKNLSVKDVASLNKRYRRLIQEENNTYNSIGEKKEFNRRQRNLYRQKRKVVMDEKKRELIDELYGCLKKGRSLGHLKNTDLLSNNPDNWPQTKKTIFVGGRYLESHDKEWCDVYKKINSPVSAHLFDLHSNTEIPKYVFKQS